MKEITEDQIKSFMEVFSDFVNGSTHDSDGVVSDMVVNEFLKEHRYLQSEMLVFLWKILGKIGDVDDRYTDPRNSAMIAWAKRANECI